jgi:hypothetical protein
MAETADRALPRIEVRAAVGCAGQGVPLAVVGADRVPQLSIGGCAAELLDPGVLVGWYGLGGELPAETASLLCEDDPEAPTGRGNGGGDSAEAAPDDQNVTRKFARPQESGRRERRQTWIRAKATTRTIATTASR